MEKLIMKVNGKVITYSSLEEFFQILRNENTTLFEIGGLKFNFNHTDWSLKTDLEAVVVCKPLNMLLKYVDLYLKSPFKNILEFGIFQGGSALFFATIFKEINKLVAIDINPFNPIIDEILNKQDLHERVKLYYKTSQDSPDVLNIIKNEFGGLLDIIIDDCSHQYELTKKTFEMAFPLLKPGGLYIIEDWGWAHWSLYQDENSHFNGQPALSNLIFELISIFGTNNGWIANINIANSALAIIERGSNEIPVPMCVSESYLYRGKKILEG